MLEEEQREMGRARDDESHKDTAGVKIEDSGVPLCPMFLKPEKKDKKSLTNKQLTRNEKKIIKEKGRR